MTHVDRLTLCLDVMVAFRDNPDPLAAAALHRGMVEAFANERLLGSLDLADLVWPPATRTVRSDVDHLEAEVKLSGGSAAPMRPPTIAIDVRWRFDEDPTFLSRVERAVRAALGALPPGATAYNVRLVADEPEIAPLSPPRVGWAYGALVEVIDHRGATPHNLPYGFYEPLPPPATRDVRDGIEVLRWARDPLDRAELERAVHAQQRWAAAKLELDIARNWNALGDRNVDDDEHGDVAPSRVDALARHRASSARALYKVDDELWDAAPAGYTRDAGPALPAVLYCDLVIAFADEVDVGRCAEVVRRVPALLHEHGVGPELAPEQTLGWPQRRVFARGSAERDVELSMWSLDRELRIVLTWPWPETQELVERLARCLVAIKSELPAGVYFLQSSLVLRNHALVSVRPPRDAGGWSYGSLLDIADLDNPWGPTFPPGFFDELPAPARRDTHGAFHVLIWARDPLTEDEVQRAWTAQQRWLARHELAEVTDERWNAQGDLRIEAPLEPRAPVTLYDPITGAGFQTLIVGDDGNAKERDLARLASLVAEGRLPDGSALTSLAIVTPTRAGAVALAPRARELGLRVAYVRGAGELWDPLPDGWLDPE